jgi:hypothetical protein
MYFGPKIL